MGIDWEEILGAEGEDILDAYEERVGDNKSSAKYNNNNNYYINDRLNYEESYQIDYLYETLDTLRDSYKPDYEDKVDDTLSILTSKEKNEILKEILERSHDVNYILKCFDKDEHFVNMNSTDCGTIDLYCIISSERIYDFWKTIREGIDKYKIDEYNMKQVEVEEKFEHMYISSRKSVKEWISALDDFYKNYYKEMVYECSTYDDCTSYLDGYLTWQLLEEYIVSSIILNVIEDFKCEQITFDEVQYNENVNENVSENVSEDYGPF